MFELGLIFTVDLSSESIVKKPVPQNLAQNYLAGRGLNAALGVRMLPPSRSALDPDSPLFIGTGLLTGTGAPYTARTHFNAVSPQTGLWGSSNVGGFLGPALCSLGIRTLVFTGRAASPVYLYLGPEGAEFRSAEHLWGLDAWDTEDRLKEDLGDRKLRVITIGPAGENRVAMSCVSVGRHSTAGRTGMGAVMGSKNLKAVVVKPDPSGGSSPDPDLKQVSGAYIRRARSAPWYETISQHGQSGFVTWTDDLGMLSTRNYQEGTFPGAADICGTSMDSLVAKRYSCARCTVHCKADVMVDGQAVPRPEFESLVALGSKCGQGKQAAVIKLNALCGRYGLDTISAGSTLAFAMELFEKGIIDLDTTHGRDIKWGDYDTQAELLRQMAHRRGFGGILADGVRVAAQKLGKKAENYAYHVKGLELCAYDPRGVRATALAYAVGERGADFAWAFPTPEVRWTPEKAVQEVGCPEAADRFSHRGKPEVVVKCAAASAVVDSLGLCKLPSLGLPAEFNLELEAQLVKAVTGWDVSAPDLVRTGRRIVNMERVINLTLSGGQVRDSLPEAFIKNVLPHLPAQDHELELAGMIQRYYRLMGWNENGVPLEATLAALGIDALPVERTPQGDPR